ncbi:uncharacterized protein ACN2A1_009437 [Glossina fuscipes fuscipes]
MEANKGNVSQKSVGRYEDEILSSVDSRPYAQTTITNMTSSQKFTSCHELLSQSIAEFSTSGYEFHLSDEELIECCTKAEDAMKEAKNVEAPEDQETIVDVVFENSPDDNKKKTIVDIIFEDFSTSPFNSPVVSPETKLRNLERSPLYILREKPRKTYSREFREKAKLALLYDSTPEREDSDRGYIEKEDTYNANETLVQFNQRKTEISNDWDDDDNDIFAFISTQKILRQDVKVNNVTSGLQKVSGERPELGEGKNEVSAGFETANGKTISISEESKRAVQNILREFQDNLKETNYETELKDMKARMQSKFGKTANSSAQIAKKTPFEAMCKEVKWTKLPAPANLQQ